VRPLTIIVEWHPSFATAVPRANVGFAAFHQPAASLIRVVDAGRDRESMGLRSRSPERESRLRTTGVAHNGDRGCGPSRSFPAGRPTNQRSWTSALLHARGDVARSSQSALEQLGREGVVELKLITGN